MKREFEIEDKKVMIEKIGNLRMGVRYFEIAEEKVYFDTDMIDWEETEQSKNGVNKLINWIK